MPGLSDLIMVDPHLVGGARHAEVSAGRARPLVADSRSLEVDIAGAGRMYTLDEWLAETHGTSLLAIDRGVLVHEWYAPGLGPDTLFLGASMTKSALAHLIGRAVTDRLLGLDDPVLAYVPELAGTGYDGVTVADLATMTSGVDWFEDHRDPESLASRLVSCFFGGGSSRDLLRQVRSGVPPGSRYEYCTADSQVLDWVRERATQRTYAEDLGVLWNDLGCTAGAVVGVDSDGVAMAGGALAATARDWARIGLLAIDGVVDGRRILAPVWVEQAVRPQRPFLEPGRLPSSITTHAGFGYHWWPTDADGRTATADGSRGQFTYVDRANGIVVVKTSRWPYDDWLRDRQYRDLTYLGLAQVAEAAVETRNA